jgi:hypothetical protein
VAPPRHNDPVAALSRGHSFAVAARYFDSANGPASAGGPPMVSYKMVRTAIDPVKSGSAG